MIELDESLLDHLRQVMVSRVGPASHLIRDDFLKWAAVCAQHKDALFDRVVMNPPYAPNGIAIDHTVAAWNCLKPGGRLVAILPSGAMTNGDRKHGFFQELVRQFGRWEDNPEDSFKEAGTDVRTITVVLDKPGEGAATWTCAMAAIGKSATWFPTTTEHPQSLARTPDTGVVT